MGTSGGSVRVFQGNALDPVVSMRVQALGTMSATVWYRYWRIKHSSSFHDVIGDG